MPPKSPRWLIPLTRQNAEEVRTWRLDDDVRGGLRTPYGLTEIQQARFYDHVVSDQTAPHRYWGVQDGQTALEASRQFLPLCAMVGLTNIIWESGNAEISLVVNPLLRRMGYGWRAVDLVLREGFDNLRLHSIFGEVYHSNPTALPFWEGVCKAYRAHVTTLPARKFWAGAYHDATIFTILAPAWREAMSKET